MRRLAGAAAFAWLVLVSQAIAAPPVGVGAWEGRAATAVPREEGSFVEVGGRFYLAFGRDRMTQEVFDPATGEWSSAGPVPANLSHVQGAVVGGRIYYPGGFAFNPRRDVGTVHIYDPADGSWTTGASMPAGRERGAGAVAVHDGKVYYLGGLRLPQVAVPWVDVYDPVADSWATLPDMPHPRDHLSAAAVGDTIYTIAGRLGDPLLSVEATDAYDVVAGEWTTGLAPIPTPRAGTAIAELGGELVVMGGSDSYVSLAVVEAYDVAQDSWRTLAPVPTARDGIQAIVAGGDVYLAGGGTLPRGTGPTDVLEVYVPTSTVRPDALMKLSTGGSMLGGDVYSLTGLGQSVTTNAGRGVTRVFRIRIENDGATSERSTVRGPGSSPGFSVRYLQGATGSIDVTDEVVAGTYLTPVLARNGSAIVRLRVKVLTGASVGASRAMLVTVESTTRPTSTDVVRATVSVA